MPVVFHFPLPAARAAIGGAGRRPPYYRPRANRARNGPTVTQSFLAPRKRAVCLFLPRLPSARGGGFPKALFPCLPCARGGSLPQARRRGFINVSLFTTLPLRCARRPLYKGGQGSDPITRFRFRSAHRQSPSCIRNRSAGFFIRYRRQPGVRAAALLHDLRSPHKAPAPAQITQKPPKR